MADTVFIISEFNPFHNGHAYLCAQARLRYPGCTVVAVMNGSFTQRGEAACADKYVRARVAVESGGCDLVLLLPSVYGISHAEGFAYGAVSVCAAFSHGDGVVFFGSECGDEEALEVCATRLLSAEYERAFSARLAPDIPYPALRQSVYESLYGSCSLLSAPNNILGVEYIKQIKKHGYGLRCDTVPRLGAGYHSAEGGEYPSAAYLRAHRGEDLCAYMPRRMADALACAADIRYGERVILDRLRHGGGQSTASGLSERIRASARNASGYDELISLCRTKVYTDSRLRRAVLALALGREDGEEKKKPDYTALLSANRAGTDFLHGRTCPIEIITKPADAESPSFSQEIAADELYSLCCIRPLPEGSSLRQTPFIMK